jgi:hypothetical protein
VSTVTVAVQLVTPSGVPEPPGSSWDAQVNRLTVRRLSVCNDQFGSSQDDSLIVTCCPESLWHRV